MKSAEVEAARITGEKVWVEGGDAFELLQGERLTGHIARTVIKGDVCWCKFSVDEGRYEGTLFWLLPSDIHRVERIRNVSLISLLRRLLGRPK